MLLIISWVSFCSSIENLLKLSVRAGMYTLLKVISIFKCFIFLDKGLDIQNQALAYLSSNSPRCAACRPGPNKYSLLLCCYLFLLHCFSFFHFPRCIFVI